MRKKLVLIIVLLFIMNIFSACTQNVESDSNRKKILEDYKRYAVSDIISYEEDKIAKNFYSGAGYSKLNDIVECTTIKINIANEMANIDIICVEAKKEMDMVDKIDLEGYFYSLQDAYTNGKLTIANIQTIATSRLDVNQLGIKEQLAIKTSYLNLLKKEIDGKDFLVEDISIMSYYGEYNGCYVVQIGDSYSDYPAEMLKCVISNIVINFSGPSILVWEKN